ncbi:MAG: stage III sporulation protein AD [Clostridia bacterium]|nr:stage III sporulation protein AD [Clostridia bacterium]
MTWNMDIFKIVGLGIAAAILAVFLKNWRPEISVQISLAAAAIIFIAVMPYIKTLFSMFSDISNRVGVDAKYITLILKVIGIAYIAQFGAELCRDAGETSIASKIELFGKVIIVTLSMPLVYSFMEVVERIINFG